MGLQRVVYEWATKHKSSLGFWEAVLRGPALDLRFEFFEGHRNVLLHFSLHGRTCHARCCDCYQLKQDCLSYREPPCPKLCPSLEAHVQLLIKAEFFGRTAAEQHKWTSEFYLSHCPIPRCWSISFPQVFVPNTNSVSEPAFRELNLWWLLLLLWPITPQSTHTSWWCRNIHYSGSNRGNVTYFPPRLSTGF